MLLILSYWRTFYSNVWEGVSPWNGLMAKTKHRVMLLVGEPPWLLSWPALSISFLLGDFVSVSTVLFTVYKWFWWSVLSDFLKVETNQLFDFSDFFITGMLLILSYWRTFYSNVWVGVSPWNGIMAKTKHRVMLLVGVNPWLLSWPALSISFLLGDFVSV
jgi:hypothetical protein